MRRRGRVECEAVEMVAEVVPFYVMCSSRLSVCLGLCPNGLLLAVDKGVFAC